LPGRAIGSLPVRPLYLLYTRRRIELEPESGILEYSRGLRVKVTPDCAYNLVENIQLF